MCYLVIHCAWYGQINTLVLPLKQASHVRSPDPIRLGRNVHGMKYGIDFSISAEERAHCFVWCHCVLENEFWKKY